MRYIRRIFDYTRDSDAAYNRRGYREQERKNPDGIFPTPLSDLPGQFSLLLIPITSSHLPQQLPFNCQVSNRRPYCIMFNGDNADN